jgi:hypothetical protein
MRRPVSRGMRYAPNVGRARSTEKETGNEKDQQSAGINRSEGGDERALRVRSNDPLGPEFGDELSRGNHRSIKQGIGGRVLSFENLQSGRRRCEVLKGKGWTRYKLQQKTEITYPTLHALFHGRSKGYSADV